MEPRTHAETLYVILTEQLAVPTENIRMAVLIHSKKIHCYVS